MILQYFLMLQKQFLATFACTKFTTAVVQGGARQRDEVWPESPQSLLATRMFPGALFSSILFQFGPEMSETLVWGLKPQPPISWPTNMFPLGLLLYFFHT